MTGVVTTGQHLQSVRCYTRCQHTHTHCDCHCDCDWDWAFTPSQSTLSSYISISSGHRNNVCSLLSTGSRLFASVWQRPHLISACIFFPLSLPLCRFSVSLYLCLSLLFSSWTVWLLICLPICAFPIAIWRPFPPAFSTPFPLGNVARLPIPLPSPFISQLTIRGWNFLSLVGAVCSCSLGFCLISSEGITPMPDS